MNHTIISARNRTASVTVDGVEKEGARATWRSTPDAFREIWLAHTKNWKKKIEKMMKISKNDRCRIEEKEDLGWENDKYYEMCIEETKK